MPKRGRPTQAELVAMKAQEPMDVRRMYEMRVKGMSIHRIAEAFKTSSTRVHSLMEKYAKAELAPYVESYRQLQLERNEYLWQKLVDSGRLEKGDPSAIMAGNALNKRLAEMLGTDAPTKMEMEMKIDPREIELRPMILAARAKAREELLAIRGETADDTIEEGEIVEEDDDE